MTLGKQIGLVAVFALVSSGIVYLIASALPKTYTSEQVLLFPTSQAVSSSIANSILGSNSSLGSDVSSFAGSMPGGISTPVVGSSPQTASGILESRKCRSFVAQKLGLPEKWKLSQQKTLEELKRRTSVRVDDNGFLVNTCNTSSAEEAQQIILAMHDYLTSGSVALTISLAKRNKQVMADRLIVSEKRLQSSRMRLVNMASNHPFVDSVPIQNLLADALKKQSEIRVSLAAAQARIAATESTIRRAINSGADLTSLEAANVGQLDRGLESLKQDLQKRRLDLEDAKKIYTSKSPEFKIAMDRQAAGANTIKKSLDESNRSLNNHTYAPLIEARAEMESLKQAEKGYELVLSDYKKMALKTPEDSSLVKIAQAQFDTALKTAESLRFQLEQATIAEERDPARFEVVDEADFNPEPIAPRKGLITGSWGAITLCIGSWMILRRRIKFVD